MNQSYRQAKPIRSFTIRGGRMTNGQRQALHSLFPVFGIQGQSMPNETIDFDKIFGRSAPTILEIGFGDGEALLAMAKANPESNHIGIEVHEPGIGHLLLQLNKLQIENIRVFRGDAVGILEASVADESLDRICLFFPDPWPKKKHHKRRIIQQYFIELVVKKLKPGGIFHFATDWSEYALEAIKKLEDGEGVINQAGRGCFSRRPVDRPETKFEKRAARLGHEVRDIMMQKSG